MLKRQQHHLGFVSLLRNLARDMKAVIALIGLVFCIAGAMGTPIVVGLPLPLPIGVGFGVLPPPPPPSYGYYPYPHHHHHHHHPGYGYDYGYGNYGY
ncbi:uncharacterized protein LOC128255167 [Drosophila gunungcola]|nr:uncharacterized protein LOC128255167 [Drosophila gunungcola]